MKAKAIILAVIACMMLSSCSSEDNTSMFVEVEVAASWKVVYHKETKVMYAVSNSGYNRGTFTLLVNADGTPMIYEGE